MELIKRLVWIILTGAVLSIALIGANAWAGLTADEVNSLSYKAERGDKTALKALMAEAERGNGYAQFDLGSLYGNGKVVIQDYAQAIQWYRKAAEQGLPYAQYYLGTLYAAGALGLPQDDAQAAQWWAKAAAQKFVQAQDASLGDAYAEGKGRIPRNSTKAAQWYRKAAERGDVHAQLSLGNFYYHGEGVPKDFAQAVQWYRKAAEQRDATALFNLGGIYANGDAVPRNNIVGYALINLSVLLNPGSSSIPSSTRSQLARYMASQEIADAQALSRQMSESSNPLKPLDQYLAENR